MLRFCHILWHILLNVDLRVAEDMQTFATSFGQPSFKKRKRQQVASRVQAIS